jgi:hypothetical protein
MRLRTFKHNGYCPDPFTSEPVQIFMTLVGEGDGPMEEQVGYDMFFVQNVTYIFREAPISAAKPSLGKMTCVTLVGASGGCGTAEGPEVDKLYAKLMKEFPRPKDPNAPVVDEKPAAKGPTSVPLDAA